ncbi:MAG: hypothetical protein HN402_07780 [Candidatus Scalindua sp.]|jgi:hypothetical protein|nr:hypothetical protein [Candidatus Scalindua sp.]MBT6757345.1 hypothetical protein [Candidatus Jacksonbacteria bacterium]
MFQIPAILKSYGSLTDGGLRLNIHTNEINKEQSLRVMELQSKFGWLVFKENEIKDEDIPLEDAPRDDFKTPSQRLRGVLYVNYAEEKKKGLQGEFREYYDKKMEGVINHFKSKLD